MAETTVSQGSQVEHIGAAPHPARNLMIGAGAVALAGLIGLYSFFTGRADKGYAAELDRFRQQMTTQCKMDQFAGPTNPELASLYADSSRMQTVVQQQLAALDRGKIDCDASL